MTAKNPYRAGSLSDPGAYIEREADQRLRKELADNRRFPFIFAPPDSGKSSLLRRTLQGLDPGQHCGVLVDLSRLRMNDYSLFIGELLTAIAQAGDFDSREIAADCPEDTFVAWLGTFPQRLIVLLDSCELAARASFSEQFFGKLKFLLNVRAENDEFGRLQLVLASSVPMGRLVPTHLQTPYTTEILLPPLSPSQVDTLAWHLNSSGVEVDTHVGAVLSRHTSGVPYLCQQLLATLWDEASAQKTPISVAQVTQLVDRSVDRAAQNEHLSELFRVIAQSPTMLDTFLRLRRGQTVDPQRMQELVSTGLCDYDQPYRCSIYERVYGPGGALDLTRAAAQRGAAEPSLEALSEPPRPPRPPESTTPASPTPSQTPRVQLLPEPPRPVPVVPAIPAVPLAPIAAGVVGLKAAGATEMAAGDFSSDEEKTAVDEQAHKLAAHPEVRLSEVPKPAEDLRALLEEQLFLSAELDSFCNSNFPAVARQFTASMSRAEKTSLLLAEAEPAAITDRLKQWEGSLERRSEVIATVVAESSPLLPQPADAPVSPVVPSPPPAPQPPLADALTSAPVESLTPKAPLSPPPAALPAGTLAELPPPPPSPPPPPPPPAAEPPPVPAARTPVPAPESPPAFREPTAVLSVGVGLVLANRYFLTSEVGHGAVAMVWNAYDRIKDEQVALKLLHGPAAESPVLVQRFWHSAQQQASLSHPAIVGVLNKPREESGIHYVVMEYVPAGNLRNWVLNSKLTRTQLLRLMQRLGSALQYAHERKVLHRNVKPTNILFDNTGHARLVDFSLQWPADAAGDKQSRADRVIYMAPEEQLGDSDGDPRSDVYSLGMCALFALFGKELPSLVMQERAAFIEQLEVPPALKAVVKRAVAMNAADRFATAAEFCRALEVDAPALPGISLRNSDARAPERRASAEDLRTIKPEPSQRMQIPALVPPPPPAAGPPPVPVVAARPAPRPAVVAPPPPAAAPPAPPPAPAPPPRLRSPDRDSDEIPPTPGRNPTAAAQYAISTEKVEVVMAAAPAIVRVSSPGLTPMLLPVQQKAGPWRGLAFATLGLLVLSGGVLTYLLGTMPSHPGGGDQVLVANPERGNGGGTGPSERPMVEALGDPTGRAQKPLTAPVVPLHQVDKGKLAATHTVKPEGKLPVKQEGGTKLAMLPANKDPSRVGVSHVDSTNAAGKSEPGRLAKPPVGPASTGTTQPQVVKVGPQANPATKIQTGYPATAPAGTPAKPIGPGPKPPNVPILAVKQPPKTWEVVTLADSAHNAEAPRTPPVPVAAGTRPLPGDRPAGSRDPDPAVKHPAGDAEAILHEAQAAFIRGERQTAIATALRVTQRGGDEAIKAWRFVGGAACSGRLATQASNAYHNLKDPEHKRLLVELCQRNGLRFNDGTFSTPEE